MLAAHHFRHLQALARCVQELTDHIKRAPLLCVYLILAPLRGGPIMLSCAETTNNDLTMVDDAVNVHRVICQGAEAGLPPVCSFGADAAAPHAALMRGMCPPWTCAELSALQ